MFCKYCGKEIPDGSVCDCQGSAAPAPEASAAPSAEGVERQIASAQGSVVINVDTGRILAGLKELFKKAFTRPASMLVYAYNQDYMGAQYASGIIYAIVMFLLPFIEFKVVLGEYAQYAKDVPLAKISFFVMLAAVLCRLAVALVLFIVNKQPFKRLLGVVSASTILALAVRIIMSLALMLNLFTVVAAVAALGLIINMALDYEIVGLSFNYRRDKVFWFFLIIEAIVFVTAYVVGYNLVIDLVKKAGMMSSLF